MKFHNVEQNTRYVLQALRILFFGAL